LKGSPGVIGRIGKPGLQVCLTLHN
jgi:hypothetical protein